MKRKAKRASDTTFYILYKECPFCRWLRLKDYQDGKEIDFETTNPQRFLDLITHLDVVDDLQERFKWFDNYRQEHERNNKTHMDNIDLAGHWVDNAHE